MNYYKYQRRIIKKEKNTLKTPERILPPATPPFKELTSAPGLLTSNERMTINLIIIIFSKGLNY